MVNAIYPHHEISRIMTAAVVSMRFRHDLLSNPRLAIQEGYGDEVFNLDQEQSDQIASIQARSLEEFATKIVYA